MTPLLMTTPHARPFFIATATDCYRFQIHVCLVNLRVCTPYSESVLLVGDGDLSFAAALSDGFGYLAGGGGARQVPPR